MTYDETPYARLPELYEQLRERLRFILFRYRIPTQDAEDLVQTTLLLAITHWPQIKTPDAWILGTLEKRCLTYCRERRRREERQVAVEETDEQLAAAPAQEHSEVLADLETLCRNLPARQREVLSLRYRLGLRPGEVARATGLRQESVRKLASRAIARLRCVVQAADPSQAPRRRGGGTPRTPSPRPHGAPSAAWLARCLAERSTPPARRPPQPFPLGSSHWPPRSMGRLAAVLLDRFAGLYRAAQPAALPANNGTFHLTPVPSPSISAISWTAAADEFLDGFRGSGRAIYRQHLTMAGAVLGRRPLCHLSVADLATYRIHLLGSREGARSTRQALSILRTFLLWAGRGRAHTLAPRAVLGALQLPPPMSRA